MVTQATLYRYIHYTVYMLKKIFLFFLFQHIKIYLPFFFFYPDFFLSSIYLVSIFVVCFGVKYTVQHTLSVYGIVIL